MTTTALAPCQESRGGAPVLLIADRDRHVLEELSVQLHGSGVIVETADSGLECVRKLRALGGGVVVLDVDLPWGRVDGVLAVAREEPHLAAFRFILAIPRGTPPPVLLSLPVVGVMERPYDVDALLEAACSPLDGRMG